MNVLELFAAGFSQLFTVRALLLVLLGVVAGIIVGATPGLTTSMGIILFLPATYSMDLTSSLFLLLGLYVGGTSGGLISAILIGIPGTPAAVPLTFDGYPLTKRGQAGKALGAGMLASLMGGFIGFLILFTVAPVVSELALKLSSVEYFSLCLFALTLVAGLSGKSMAKGIASALLGIMFSTVGLSSFDSTKRFTFGFNELNGGFLLIVVLIGLYATVEILKLSEGYSEPKIPDVTYKQKGFNLTRKEIKGQIPNLIRSALVGTGVGFLPGLGAGISSMLSYSVAKNSAKDADEYGTGAIGGVVAPAAAGNAVIGGALIPLLTMGIPGDSVTSLLLAALLMNGVTAGPLMFTKQPLIIYTMFATLVLANILMLVCEYYSMPLFLKVVKVPSKYLLPIVIVLGAIGAFGNNNRTFDVITVLIFTLVGYAARRFKYPVPPFVMGFILGPLVEKHLLRGIQLSYGSFLPFITRPVSCMFLVAALAMVIWTVIKQARANKPKAQPTPEK